MTQNIMETAFELIKRDSAVTELKCFICGMKTGCVSPNIHWIDTIHLDRKHIFNILIYMYCFCIEVLRTLPFHEMWRFIFDKSGMCISC